MAPRSPLEYDVSAAADKRRRTRRRGMSGAFETDGRCCEWPGCEGAGQYRAPLAPERLGEYRWFCLDHVRAYNESWNYFGNLDESELEARLRHATVWERPTWRLGRGPRGSTAQPHADGQAWARAGFADPFELLGGNATISPPPDRDSRPRRRLSRAEQTALDTLGVPHQVSDRRTVRAAYRALVKDLHPDMNGGRNPEPERLARVLKAWDLLRRSPHFTD